VGLCGRGESASCCFAHILCSPMFAQLPEAAYMDSVLQFTENEILFLANSKSASKGAACCSESFRRAVEFNQAFSLSACFLFDTTTSMWTESTRWQQTTSRFGTASPRIQS
jgi:hypothetical protein